MAALGARRAAFENAVRAGRAAGSAEEGAKEGASEGAVWTSADARALEEEVERARRGLLFLAVKT